MFYFQFYSHALEYFRHIDMSVIDPYFNIVPNYSEPWNDVFKKYNTSKSGASLNFPSPIGLASILLLAGCLFSVQVWKFHQRDYSCCKI